MSISRLSFAALLTSVAWSISDARAQVRASERGRVEQIVDGTRIAVDYSRPQLRGRTPFGGVVRWGETWTPGANWATTIEVSQPVEIEGHAVAAGKYSLWTLPGRETWTVGLHRDANRFHTQRPKEADFFVSFTVTPREALSLEVLTFTFPEIRRTGATLVLQWGTTAVPIRIEVQPTAPPKPVLTPEQVAPYLGEYIAWAINDRGDTLRMTTRLGYENGRLVGKGEGSREGFELVPTGEPHRFFVAGVLNGKVFDLQEEAPATFEIVAGRAVGFTVKGIGVELWMKATRVR